MSPPLPQLTLYRKNGACSIAAHMLLLELAIPFTDVALVPGPNELYEGAPGTYLTREHWLKINPTGYVPALHIDSTTIITELSAVLFYISSLRPDRGFFGCTPLESAQVLEWLSYLSTTLNEYGFAGYWRPERMVGLRASAETLDALRKEGKKTILKGFAWIEARLEHGRCFAVGNATTVVDFVLHTMWRWGVQGGFAMHDMCPNFAMLVQSVEKMGSVRYALRKEGIDLSFPNDD